MKAIRGWFFSSKGYVRLRAIALVLLAGAFVVVGAPPGWWANRGVTNQNAADDYAPLNQGQLKKLVKGAVEELDAYPDAGAGDELHTLITNWATPTAKTDDFAAVNIGQLKAVTKLVYDRLKAIGYTDAYPWESSPNPPDDYAMANIGQAKKLFAFDLSTDTSGDGVPDWIKVKYNLTPGDGYNTRYVDGETDGLTWAEAYQYNLLNSLMKPAVAVDDIRRSVKTGESVTITLPTRSSFGPLTYSFNSTEHPLGTLTGEGYQVTFSAKSVADGGKAGVASFGFIASDGRNYPGNSAAATLSVAVDLLPLETNGGGADQWAGYDIFPVEIQLFATGGTGDYQFAFVALPTQGEITDFDPTTGKGIYTPNSVGPIWDDFTFTVSDGFTTTAPGPGHVNLYFEHEGPSVSIVAHSPGKRIIVAGEPSTTGDSGTGGTISPNNDNDEDPTSAADPAPKDNGNQFIGDEDDDIVMIELHLDKRETTGGTLKFHVPLGYRVFDDSGTNVLATTASNSSDVALSANNDKTTVYLEALDNASSGEFKLTYDYTGSGDGGTTEDKEKIFPHEFLTKAEDDDETTVATIEVGPTNQEPIVELAEITSGQVTVSQNTATLHISGVIRDAIMDNVPAGAGADIVNARVYLNDELEREVTLTRQGDGAPSFWRKYPARLQIPTFAMTVPADEGMAVVRIETSPNASGLVGSAEIVIEFMENRPPGPLEGGYTRSYSMAFGGSTTATAIDSLILRRGTEATEYTLTETGPNTLVFASPIPSGGTAPTLVVRLAQPYTAEPSSQDTIGCKVSDLEFDGEILSSMPAYLSCTETGASTETFTYTETQLGFQTYGPATYSVHMVRVSHNEKQGGNHPFTFRTAPVSETPFRHRFGAAEFETISHGGMKYPRLNSGETFIGYLVDNQDFDPPRRELLYYDSSDSQLHRAEITNPQTDLALSVVAGTTTISLSRLLSGELEFVDGDGNTIESISRVSAETLVDLINGDQTIEIEDDSWERVRVRVFGEGADLRVRVQSSEVESDFFDFMVNPPPSGKVAALTPIGGGLYESELKILVYESTPEISLLSDSQWHALKTMGFLAVHNASARAKKVKSKTTVATNRGARIHDHHLFPREFRDEFRILFGRDFRIDDFCVPIKIADHQTIHTVWNAQIRNRLARYLTPLGTFIPGIDRAAARADIMRFILDPTDGSLCSAMGVNPVKTVRWGSKGKVDTTNAFVKAVKKHGSDKLSRALHPGLVGRIGKIASRTAKQGIQAAHKVRHIGVIIGAWALLTKSPVAAAASMFDVTEDGVAAFMDGMAIVGLELRDPQGSVKAATLADGHLVQESDAFQRVKVGALGIVVFIDEGEVDYLTPSTGFPGAYDVTVRYGQESETYRNCMGWKVEEAVVGLPLPPSWR